MIQKKTIKVILLCVTTALLGVGGYFVYTKFVKVQERSSITTKTIKQIQWKLFYNERLGFQFKYPEDWSVSVRETEHYNVARLASESGEVYIIVSHAGTRASLGVDSLEEWVENLVDITKNYREIAPRQEIVLPQGIKGIEIHLLQGYTNDYEQHIFLEHDGKFYSILMILPNKSSRDFFQGIYQHIVLTFNPI